VREDYTLLTPENVELRYDLAGVGSRLVAAAIDYTILIFFYLSFSLAGSFVLGAVRRLFPSSSAALDLQWAGFAVIALFTLLVFFGWWGYFLLFEMLWNGQTPGKRLLQLRVVLAGGQPINATSSLVRNLLRVIDLMLGIGIIAMLLDHSSRRLGDFAAGSLVVREPRALDRRVLAPVPIPEVSEDVVQAIPNAGRLTTEHYALMRDFFARRDRLPGRAADILATRLADDLARLLEVPSTEIGEPGRFIAAVARAFEARHRYQDRPERTAVGATTAQEAHPS
jgi:uncharacterized RDD family membrane protein YckC